jgi:hypothetical protein
MKRKKWVILLNIAILFCIIGALANFGLIFSNNDTISNVFKQLMYIGCIIISICAINYNKIK